jgi:hypothetical protein
VGASETGAEDDANDETDERDEVEAEDKEG